MTDFGRAPIRMEGGIADPDEFTWECNCEDCKVKHQKWKEGACNVVVPLWLSAMACLNPNGVDRRVYPDNGCDLGKLKLKEKNNA